MIDRRALVAGLGAGVLAPAAGAHTLYPQWVAYRRKHLLIGCHRKDLETYRLAQQLVMEMNKVLPKAKARVARAPHPQRLASLIGTDQMEIAVLSRSEAAEMRNGAGRFAPYGRLALTRLADFGPYLLAADAGFPKRHAWMIADALAHSGLAQNQPKAVALPLHRGAEAHIAGQSLSDLAD